MTILVGVLCKDGVIIGADGSATFAAGKMPTIEQPTQKIEILKEHMVIVAGTGEIGLGQRFTHIVSERFRAGGFKGGHPVPMMTDISQHVLQNFHSTGVQAPRIEFGALVAFLTKGELHLCEFSAQTMQPELKNKNLWYCSMGSGQLIVDPFLGLMRQAFWDQGPPTRQDAIFAVTWALQHAIKCNPGGINDPIQIAELTKDGKGLPQARCLSEDELQEHRQNVDGAVKHLGAYSAKLKGEQPTAVAEVPKPGVVALPVERSAAETGESPRARAADEYGSR